MHVLRAFVTGAAMACGVMPALAQTSPAAALPSASTAIVTGQVVDRRDGLAIAGALVTLSRGGRPTVTTATDASGRFSFSDVAPGIYVLGVRANGYVTSASSDVVVTAGSTVRLDAVLVQAQTAGTAGYRTIGAVSTSSNATLATATTITQSISVPNLEQTGQLRFADQLGTLPALNVATSSAPGDDVSVNIRGFGSTETATLLDNRPVGPLGVLAPDSFNYADTPIFGLSNVDVTYGSGAQGLYGSDTIAGAINLELLNPTPTNHAEFEQRVGGFGISSTSFDATGTIGRLGFAAAAGTNGETGAFDHGQLFQSARPELLQPGSVTPPYACANVNGNDVSACNQAAETYAVSQDTKVSADMLKLRYSLTPTTQLQISGYSSVQVADSTGNGDNDYLPYASRLGQILEQTSNCTTASGAAGYTVITNPNAGLTACDTAQQFAAASSGPDGGGAGRNRSASMRDYDARFTTRAGINNITLDTYVNNYDYEKDSSLSGGLDANGIALGTPDFTDYYNTHGYLVSDDIVGRKNDLSFGYSILDQLQSSQQEVTVGNPNPVTGESQLAFQSTYPPALFRESSEFLRDDYQFNNTYSVYANAWLKRSNVTQKTTFDPRLTLQIHPDTRNVLRVTYGRSDGPPAPELKSTAPVFEQDPGSSLTSVSCSVNALPNSAGNPNLTSEGANDFELGLGHRFNADSNIQANAYVTSVADQLISATEPLTQYGVANVRFDNTILQTYLSRLITQGCIPAGAPLTSVYPFLGVSTTYNIGHELARGIDFNGHQRINHFIYVDYAYSIESSQVSGIPDSILSSNFTLLNGGQQLGIPLHQGTISVDIAPGPWEFRLDNYYVDGNNPLDRPAYWHSNAFITRSLGSG
jgi:hypothetical protein